MLINISDLYIEELLKQARAEEIEKIVVGAVVVNPEYKILVLQRIQKDFMGGLVELPSGVVYSKESLLNGLVREVKEETGLDITEINYYIGSFDYLSSSGKNTRQLSFLVSTFGNKIILNNDEHSMHYWVTVKGDLYSSLNISIETRKIIALANELNIRGE